MSDVFVDLKEMAQALRRTSAVFDPNDLGMQMLAGDTDNLVAAFERADREGTVKALDHLELASKVVFKDDWRSAEGEVMARIMTTRSSEGSMMERVGRLSAMRFVQGLVDTSREKLKTLEVGSV